MKIQKLKNSKIALIGFVLLFVGALGFVSCEKENISTNKTKGTGLVDPVEFGKLHNEYLLKAIENTSLNKKMSNKQAFMNVSIDNISVKTQSNIYDEISRVGDSQMKDTIISYLKNPLAKIYFEEIDKALDTSINYSDLNNRLSLIKAKVDENLLGKDWDVIMVYAETIQASSRMWYSKEMGGNGIGYAYRNNPSVLVTMAKTNEDVPDWVKADGRGAGYGMVAWSFSALLGPVGAAGLVYGAVAGAVTNSFLP